MSLQPKPITTDQMARLLRDWMQEHEVTQASLARSIGRSPKHVNQVLNGKAGTNELDYWAWTLGLRFTIELVKL